MLDRPIARRRLLHGTAGALALAALRPLGALAAPDEAALDALIADAAEPLPPLDDPAFAAAFDRFAEARVVLMGEATHGSAEFYRARAAITRRLVERHGFTIVAVEADWPDAAHVDAYVRGGAPPVAPAEPFARFPTWMWRNAEMRELVDWLRRHNAAQPEARRAGFHGLDLYSLDSSMAVVEDYLRRTDPAAAAEAERRYACLAPFRDDPDTYGANAVMSGGDPCGDGPTAVAALLRERAAGGDPAAFDAWRNAVVVADAAGYYRAQYAGGEPSWNLRDRHMFDTLLALLEARGPEAKAVVWAHNSHVGNAAATEVALRGELNIGQLARQHFGEAARLIGFGTDRGTVMAASRWDGPPEVKTVRPALPGSCGAIMRRAAADRFLLDLRRGVHEPLRAALAEPILQRAIGVLYLPETERQSHYYHASLPEQFDAYVWFEETRAVTPLAPAVAGLPPDHPLAAD